MARLRDARRQPAPARGAARPDRRAHPHPRIRPPSWPGRPVRLRHASRRSRKRASVRDGRRARNGSSAEDGTPTIWAAKPTAAALDVATSRPVALRSHDCHSVWANSAALRAAGIGSGTPDPSGGVIERDESGSPTGVLRENATRLIDSVTPCPEPRPRMRTRWTAPWLRQPATDLPACIPSRALRCYRHRKSYVGRAAPGFVCAATCGGTRWTMLSVSV